jgi:hypothetical protein
VLIELLLVEDGVGIVGFDQKINVKVYEREDACFESGRSVDVAVELEQATFRRKKTKDTVPAISPEKLSAERSRLDQSYERVAYFFRENSFEDDQRAFAAYDSRGPDAIHAPVMLTRMN